jgi:hypothetical protein
LFVLVGVAIIALLTKSLSFFKEKKKITEIEDMVNEKNYEIDPKLV